MKFGYCSPTRTYSTHPETHADAAVNFHPMCQLTARDPIVDVALSEMGGRRADIPMVLECDRAHAALRRFDRDLNHILRAVHEIRIGMNVTIDGSLEQLIFDPRINLQHLRVVFQHLIKIVFGVELPHSGNRQRSPHHQFFGCLRICSKITHEKSPFN